MKFKAKLVAIKEETADTKTLTFESLQRPAYKPGQFFMIEFLRPEKLPKRSYSCASSPERKGTLDFTVKQMPEGWISKLLNEAPVGEEFMLDGPWGHFVFDPEKMQEIVMLGAGSGVAPFRCFCQYMIDKRLATKATLIYTNKTEQDIICRSDLDFYAKQLPNLKLVYGLTREQKDGFMCNRIDQACMDWVIAQNPDAFFFICGPPAMVADTEKLLLENNIPKERIKTEKYG